MDLNYLRGRPKKSGQKSDRLPGYQLVQFSDIENKPDLFLILFRTTVFPGIVSHTLFEINKRDISEGSTFKKFNHTMFEFSDNGMYQKVQPLKSSTIHWLNFLITGYIEKVHL